MKNYSTKLIIKQKKTHTNPDIKIKHCKSCDCCWEMDYQSLRNMSKKAWSRKEEYIYYEDFVTYGKVKEICPRCS